jgi:hypothetical protein
LPIVQIEQKNFILLQLFAILNFTLQLLSLYSKDSFIWELLNKIFAFFKERRPVQTKTIQNDSEIKSILAGITNEAVYVLFFTSLNISIFQRTFHWPSFDYGSKKAKRFCTISFENIITFNPQNIFILFAINFFYFFYLILPIKDQKKAKFSWKLDDHTFLTRIWSAILFQGQADVNFQYYIYLYLLGKK